MSNVWGQSGAVWGQMSWTPAGAPPAGEEKQHMAQVQFDPKDFNDDELKTFIENHITSMTNNSHFPTPLGPESFATVTGAFLVALDNQKQKQQQAAEAVRGKLAARKRAEDALRQRASAIELTGADEAAIVSTGFRARGARPSPAPGGGATQPANFAVTRGDEEGTVDGQCHKVAGARSYKVEHSTTATGPWTLGYEGTKSSFTIAGLTPGQVYYFHMAAFTTGGWGPWSDLAECRVA